MPNQSKWEELQAQLSEIQTEFNKSYKCLNKTQLPSGATQAKHLNILVTQHNAFVTVLKPFFQKLTPEHKGQVEENFKALKNKLQYILSRQEISNKVPLDFVTKLELKFMEGENEEEIELPVTPTLHIAQSSSSQITKTPKQNPRVALTKMPINTIDFINTATKLLPEFDGKAEGLQTFLNSLDLLETIKETHESVAVAIIKTKVKGTLLTAIDSETTINGIKTIIKANTKGESVQSVTAKLLAVRQNNKNASDFTKEIEELSEKLKIAYLMDGIPGASADRYAAQAAVKTLRSNANSAEARIVMKAGQFANTAEAITKFMEVSNETQETLNVHYIQNSGRNGPRHRGRNGRFSINPNFRTNFNGRSVSNTQNFNSNNFNHSNNQQRNRFRQYNGRYNSNQNRTPNRNYRNNGNIRCIEAAPENGLSPQDAQLGSLSLD